jgi:hypothetical protein
MAREWYRFFVNLYNIAGGGNNSVSIDDLQLGPSNGASTDDFAEMQKTLQELELQPPISPSVLVLSATSLGNPTATVGPTAINGTALTAMRSDAAPALNLAANYTVTGVWTFNYPGVGHPIEIWGNSTNWQATIGYNGPVPGITEFLINNVSFSGTPTLALAVSGNRYFYITAGVGAVLPDVAVQLGATFTINDAKVRASTGSPNGVVTGNPGDLYLNKSGGAGTTLYVKESGSGTNTGWVGK